MLRTLYGAVLVAVFAGCGQHLWVGGTGDSDSDDAGWDDADSNDAAAGSDAAQDAPSAAGGLASNPGMSPSATGATPTAVRADGGIDSGISAECDMQLTKCNSTGPNLIRDCVAVTRRCLPVDTSPECEAQLDKCEQGNDPLVDCPLVALVCP